MALVTPFKANKAVDYEALDRMVETVTLKGVDFLVVLGTTAETPTLTPEEKKEITARVIAKNAGKLPIVVGLGSNNTRELEDALKKFDTKGVDAIMSITPYYNKPSQKGLYEHFKVVAAASERPVILYNVPGRTGVNMSADTCLLLAEDKNIIAVKDASVNMAQIGRILRDRPKGFHVFSGDDSLTLAQLAMGVDGVISVAANSFPRDFSQMVRHALQGDFKKAASLHLKMINAIELLFVEGNPTGVKAALAIQGLLQNELRLPMVSASADLYAQLEKEMKTIG